MFSSWDGLSDTSSTPQEQLPHLPLSQPLRSFLFPTKLEYPRQSIPTFSPELFVLGFPKLWRIPYSNSSFFLTHPCASRGCQQREQGDTQISGDFCHRNGLVVFYPLLCKEKGAEISSSTFLGGKDEGWEG